MQTFITLAKSLKSLVVNIDFTLQVMKSVITAE